MSKKSKLQKTVVVPKTKKQNEIEKCLGMNRQLEVGVHNYSLTTNRTSTTVLTDIVDYQDTTLDDRAKVVVLARKLRSVEGICSTVADLLCDFGITKGYFDSDNDELKKLLNDWANSVNGPMNNTKVKGFVFPVAGLTPFSKRIFDDYITDGDAVFTVFWQKGIKLNLNDSQTYMLPVSLKAIDTLNLSINADLAQMGVELIELTLNDNLVKLLKSPVNDAGKYLVKLIPKEWMKFINNRQPIVLDPNVTYHIKRNGKDYKPWGVSLFVKAFGAVATKRKLQAVDNATIDGLINRITIFKLGLPNKDLNPAYHVVSQSRVNSLVDMLNSLKRTNSFVWPGPDLEVEDVGPDGKILEFDGKYKQADIDILRALHVPPLLIDGTSTATAQSWITFLSTDVGLNAIRYELEQIYTQLAMDIAIANNIKFETVSYKFETLPLKDEQQVRNFALKVYELGGLSVETFVKSMGYDYDVEKRRKEKEESDGTKELFVNTNVPGYTGVPGPTTPTNPDGGDGRPPGSKTVTKTKTEKKPAAASGINPYDSVTLYFSVYNKIFEKMSTDITNYLNLNDDLEFASFMLKSKFTEFEQLVNSQLKTTYLEVTGGNITKDLDILLSWNKKVITKFFDELNDSLKEGKELFLNRLDKSGYRIFSYAQESYKKARWVGLISLARLSGKTKGIWKCKNTEESNTLCVTNHEQKFDLDYLVENFPGHPNCSCKLEFE
jgi:hypothetical protein